MDKAGLRGDPGTKVFVQNWGEGDCNSQRM